MSGSRWYRRFLNSLILLLISWLLLAAAYVSLGRQFVPALADYQDELVAWVERETGRAIDLQSLDAEMQGSQPVFTLQGLRVYQEAERDSPVLLELQHVTARLDVFASLWQRKPVMDALQLEGLALEFIQNAEGQWLLSGLGEGDSPSDGLDQALQRLSDQRRITLLDTHIRISPWARPEWVFSDGDLTLLNKGQHHQLDARMRLPDQQLVSLQLQGALPDRDWRRADVQFFADLPSSDWYRWLPAEWLEQAQLQRVVAGGQFWGHWRKIRLDSLVGQLQVPVLELSLPRTEQPIEDLQLQFSLQLEDDQQRLDIEQLSLTIDQQRWPQTRLQLSRQPTRGDWQARADRIPLDLLGQWLPVVLHHERAAEILTSLAPEGELRNVLASGAGFDDFADWSLRAELDDVGTQAYGPVPGFSGISGVISGTPAAGQLHVNSDDWSIYLADLFPEPWHYHSLEAGVNWAWSEAQGFQLNIPGGRVQGPEGEVTALLDLHLMPPAGPPTMDLRVALSDSRAEHYVRYLPTVSEAMTPALTEWLHEADISGVASQVIFAYEGSLRAAATSDERAISLYAQLQQGRLNFQPGWPALEQVDATLHMRNTDLDITPASAQLLQTRLDNVHVALEQGEQDALRLQISGELDGPLADGLAVMQDTPLAGLTGDPLDGWRGEGTLQGSLQLGVPLGSAQNLDLHLHLQAEAAQLDIPLLQAPLRNLSGVFTYQHDEGLSSDAIKGEFLNQPISAQLQAGGGTHQLRLRGTHGFGDLLGWPLLAGLPEKLADGRAAWNAELLLGNNLRRLVVQSELQGMRLNLPGELAKDRDTRLPSRLQLDMGEVSRWRFQLGDAWRGRVLARNGSLWGDIRYRQGNAQEPAAPGIAVSARLDSIELEHWREWSKEVLPAKAVDDIAALPTSSEQLLNNLYVQVGQLKGFGLNLQDLAVSASPYAQGWELISDHPRLSGSVRLPAQDGRPIELDLRRLGLSGKAERPIDGDDLVEPLLPEDPLKNVNPADIPSMQVQIDQLYWDDELVGSTAFTLQPQGAAVDISDIDLSLRGGLQVLGSMRWDAARSRFDGTLEAEDIGQVMQAWQYAPSLSSKQFTANVGLDWPGSPAWFALKRASGSLAVQARDGTVHSGESSADALRVFGLLNFNALTRRLRLDFSDLFGKGVAYDTFNGEAAMTNGLLQTMSPLVMDGPSAKLQLDGTLDLPSDRVDMGLLVTLPVTNNLPLAAIIAGAPHVGGVLFLVDRILGDRVARFASVRYRISGSWKQPNVEFDRAFDDKAALED